MPTDPDTPGPVRLGVYLPEPVRCDRCRGLAPVYYELRDNVRQLKCRRGHWIVGTAVPVMTDSKAQQIEQAVWGRE